MWSRRQRQPPTRLARCAWRSDEVVKLGSNRGLTHPDIVIARSASTFDRRGDLAGEAGVPMDDRRGSETACCPSQPGTRTARTDWICRAGGDGCCSGGGCRLRVMIIRWFDGSTVRCGLGGHDGAGEFNQGDDLDAASVTGRPRLTGPPRSPGAAQETVHRRVAGQWSRIGSERYRTVSFRSSPAGR